MKFFFKKLHKDISAVAAIEFAILLPLLLLLFFGSFEISRYAIAARKADSIANDIGYLISREGNINDADLDENTRESGEDADRLRSIIESVVPMMIYPFENEDYELEVRFVGIPANPVRDADGDGNDDNGIDRTTLRIMWAHCEKRLDAPSDQFEIDCDSGEGANVTNQDKAEIINKSSESIGGTSYSTSTYFDVPDRQRAKIALPGQSFILVNFAYSYNQILKNFSNLLTLNFNDKVLEKMSTYAVRSRWIDKPAPGETKGDGKIQPSEFRNDMHICEECNIWRSNDLGGGIGREPCEASVPNDDPSSGCDFSR